MFCLLLRENSELSQPKRELQRDVVQSVLTVNDVPARNELGKALKFSCCLSGNSSEFPSESIYSQDVGGAQTRCSFGLPVLASLSLLHVCMENQIQAKLVVCSLNKGEIL